MEKQVTDWNRYYRKPFKAAGLTRRYTARRLKLAHCCPVNFHSNVN